MSETQAIDQKSVSEVFEIFQNPQESQVLVDIRQPEEWNQGTIPGVQKTVLDVFLKGLDDLDKSKHYIMICRSGARSNRACGIMQADGFEKVSNFSGGMLAWKAEDHPTE